MNTRTSLALGFSTVALLVGPAGASPVTGVPGGIDTHVITFSPYAGFTSPRQIDGVIDVGTAETGLAVNLEFNDGRDHILGAVQTEFGVNGSWPVDGAFAGIYQATGNMTFTFASGMNFVGALVNINYAFDGNATVAALDINGEVLLQDGDREEFTLNPHDFTSGFFGFSRASADIYGLLFSSANIAADNLTFGTTQGTTGIPEPATTALALAALGALALTRRRA